MMTIPKIFIIGCGGLGGYVAEELAKLDKYDLCLIDGDKFDKSNMERQLFCNNLTLGKPKAEMVQKYLSNFSNKVIINLDQFLTDKNIDILCDATLVIDCLDNVGTRLLIDKYCKFHNIPIIHGGVSGFTGQVLLNLPDDKYSLNDLFKDPKGNKLRTNVYAVATIASIQVALADKYLSGNYLEYRNKLILIDLENLTVKHLTL